MAVAGLKALVTGSAGHLGEALVRTLQATNASGEGDPIEVVGLDIKPSPFTAMVGSITDVDCVSRAVDGMTVIFHTATLHKPHVATHPKQAFVDTNVTGGLGDRGAGSCSEKYLRGNQAGC